MSSRPPAKFGSMIARLAALTLYGSVMAEPMVVGYEHFHHTNPSADGGRLLFNELGCANCHRHDTGLPARRGPTIENIAERINVSWVREFLQAPTSARPGSTMPHMFEGEDPEEIDTVLHYLGSLESTNKKPTRLGRHVDAAQGERLYHSVGCVACHEPHPDRLSEIGLRSEPQTGYPSVSFPDVAKKYSLNSLTEFLKNPLTHRPDGRMPRIELTVQEATDLAGYLFRFPGSDPSTSSGNEPFSVNASLAERGKNIVAEKRCAACHDLPGKTQVKLDGLPTGLGGCLDTTPGDGLPRYELSKQQIASLEKYLSEPVNELPDSTAATLTLEALNCLACHERDGTGGPDPMRIEYFVGNPDIGDSGRLPPPLSGIGDKLKPDWFREIMLGKHRVRPYLKTRMPNYGTSTDNIHQLLARVDDRGNTDLPNGNAAAGQKLLGTIGGNGCIACHSWNGRPSLGIPALDIGNISKRLQSDWVYHYLIDPASYRSGTLMPSFWPNGVAANGEILDGDKKEQIAAIIAFAELGSGEPPGFPSADDTEFELIPIDRPIVQRTFMEGVGTHAILVGFPEGIHIAYDGLHAHPVMAWKGRFFDAYSTWFSRFAPFENPLGESIIRWENKNDDDRDVRFLGYQLDSGGIPTFLHSVDRVRIAERFQPVSSDELFRQLKWDPVQLKEIAITHPSGVVVRESPDSVSGHLKFVYLWK